MGQYKGCKYNGKTDRPGEVTCSTAELPFTCLGYETVGKSNEYACGFSTDNHGTQKYPAFCKVIECLIY